MESFKKYLNERKKICIFDFDDTLCFTDSKIRLKHDDNWQEYSPKEFHKLNIAYTDTEHELDFSDFQKIVKPRINSKVMNIFKKRLLEKEKVIILTARGETEPVAKFIKSLGFANVEVFSSQEKGQFILDLIDKEKYNEVEYYDDHKNFIEDAKFVRSVRPKVIFNIFLIDENGTPHEV